MGEGDLRCVVRPPERPTQVHPDHHAVDGAVAVAVAEHVAVVEPVDEVVVLRKLKKRYKNSCLPFTVPKKNVWSLSKRDVRQMSRRQTQTHYDSTIITST